MATRFLLLVMLGPSTYAQTGTFTPTGNMIMPRFGHTATLLPDGRVLITGGNTISYFGFAFPGYPCLQPDRAELYDPATGTFTLTGSMSTAYHPESPVPFFAALPTGPVLLPNGKVLFVGYDSVELYDPSTGDYSTVGKGASSATLLSDGRVLLIGGNVAELYDPASGNFSPIANWPGQQSWFPVAIADDTVLLVYSFDYESESERYDPATGVFWATGSIGNFDILPLPTLLPNGKVLFTGGKTDFGNDNRAELYDPATGIFASTGSMSTYRNSHSATLLPDGTVLVAGGQGQFRNIQPPLASTEIYDPATGGFSTTGSLAAARYGHTATLLKNGQDPALGPTNTSVTARRRCWPPWRSPPAKSSDVISGRTQAKSPRSNRCTHVSVEHV